MTPALLPPRGPETGRHGSALIEGVAIGLYFMLVVCVGFAVIALALISRPTAVPTPRHKLRLVTVNGRRIDDEDGANA